MKKVLVKKAPPKEKKSGRINPSARIINSVSRPVRVGLMIAVFMISLFCFSPSLKNDFITTWDDQAYVIANELLHPLSGKNIREIFTIDNKFNWESNNYHPLTTLSLALNYSISKLSPASYHLTNLIIHGINAVLVFLFIYFLSDRRTWVAFLAGLWFGIHPMHVESVAWISERKDVLYGLFFLSGLITYLYYLRDRKNWQLAVTFVLFVCSVLAKAMAVPFPLILFLIDFYKRRSFTRKLLFEKVPFLIVSVIFGLLSLHLQSKGAINTFETFTVTQRIMHASYGFIEYMVKFFVPGQLSAFYPYPLFDVHHGLPFLFKAAPILLLLMAAIIIWLLTRKEQIARVIAFGILFYFFMVILVLQFISVGKAITADRYTYIPYIGLTFILGMITDNLLSRKKIMKIAGWGLMIILIFLSLSFFYSSYERSKIWKNDISVWTDALEKYADVRMNFIYEKRARVFLKMEQYDKALSDYLTILKNDPKNENAYESIGRIYGQHMNNLDKALEYLEQGYLINPKNLYILKSLGVAFGLKGQISKALDYSLLAYQIDPEDPLLLKNISGSYTYLGNPAKAAEFSRKATDLENKSKLPKSSDKKKS